MVTELSEIEKRKLEKLSEENEFFNSLLEQWKQRRELSDKQYSYINMACQKEKNAVKNTKKLTDY